MPQRPCARCGHPQPVELEMQVKSGRVLTMTSCSKCEVRTWVCDGQVLTQQEALKLAAGDPDFALKERTTAERPPRRR